MKPPIFAAITLLCSATMWTCCAQVLAPPKPVYAPQIEPKSDTIFTSTREIRDLKPIPVANGIWAATSGGVLEFNGQKWSKSTRRDGLPSHEALEIGSSMHLPIARFPRTTAFRSGATWTSQNAAAWQKPTIRFTWKGRKVSASLSALQFGEKVFPLPPQSSGTHISAVLNVGPTLLIAVYGDGLWNFDSQNWKRAAPVPANAREITAIARDGVSLWIGTRRDGIFRQLKGRWTQQLQPDEPFSHNIQNLAEFGGVLWASTLDDGLVFRTGSGWKHVSTPVLSSSAPRQMLVWQGRLWVRHGGGLVDCFDGQTWTKNALKSVPRQGIYALAGDQTTLFAAGWGGWSEWNGTKWTPHFEVPELKGIPILGLFLDGDWLWIATQSRGLGRFNRKTDEFRWFDERDGLSDDWVTSLAQVGGKIYAGTFVGGLARLDGEKWHVFEALRGENVTSLAADEQGSLFAATRRGVWKISGEEATRVEKPWLDSEAQALLKTKNGLWVGARTSLNFLTGKS